MGQDSLNYCLDFFPSKQTVIPRKPHEHLSIILQFMCHIIITDQIIHKYMKTPKTATKTQ